MQKLVWQNTLGDVIDLTSGSYGITNWEGFANTSLNIQSQQVPFQDGGVFLDALMEQRELSVTLAISDNNDLEKRYRLRRELIHALNPKLGEGYLIYTNNFISKKIKCVPQIPLFETHNSNDSGTPKASLTWTACEPYWEDINDNSKTLNVGVIETIENNGDVPTEMEIDFSISNTTNPKIENLTTGKSIQLNGEFNENININLNMGKKSITEKKIIFDYTNLYITNKVFYSDRFNLYISINEQYDYVSTSKDGKYWHSLSSSDTFYSVYCDNNMIFIFGYSKCLRSLDGENWDTIEINTKIKKVCFFKTTDEYFGIGGSYYDIYKSTNIINWSLVEGGSSSDEGDICCSDTVICCANGKIRVSSDGENWDYASVDEDSEYIRIIYAKEMNIFMAVGNNDRLAKGCIATSPDGINWTEKFVEGAECKSVGFISGLHTFFVTVDQNNLIKSTNAIDWESVNFDFEIESLGEISIANYSVFLPYYKDYNQYNVIKTTDGINWNKFIDGQIMFNVAYSEKLGIYCGYRGEQYGGQAYIYYSYDCINWTPTFSVESWYGYTDIKYCEKIGKFLACTYGGDLYSSTDGINWQNLDVELSFGAENMNICVSEKLGLFLVSTEDTNYNSFAISYDGVTFTEYTLYDNGYGYFTGNIVYSEKLDLFCGKVLIDQVGSLPKHGVATSPDGINWTMREYGDNDSLGYICKSENLGMFVSVRKNIGISYDGLNWTIVKELETNLEYQYLKSVVYSEELGLFCAVGFEKILISPDGINWVNKRKEEYGMYFNYVNFIKKLDAFFISFESTGIGAIITSTENASNIISQINSLSDMSLDLIVGKNDILLTHDGVGLSGRILFRQKYIGV